jgi:hypothetical protein
MPNRRPKGKIQLMNIPNCPVLKDVNQIQDLSKDLTRTMRKLRRDLLTCQTCGSAEDCPVLKEFNATVTAAIDQVTDEWNLADYERKT